VEEGAKERKPKSATTIVFAGMAIVVSDVETGDVPVEVGRYRDTAKTVDIALAWGLKRYNSTRPSLIPKGTTVVRSVALRSVVAEVLVLKLITHMLFHIMSAT
jgi:hypothetical protein